MDTLSNLILAVTASALCLSACADPIEAALPPDATSPGGRFEALPAQQAQNSALPPSVTIKAAPAAKKAPPKVTPKAIAAATPKSVPVAAQNIAPHISQPSSSQNRDNHPNQPLLATQFKLLGEQPFFDVKKCINLGNALEAPKEGEWGYKIREEDLSAIADAGFDTVRIPIRWDSHMQDYPPYAVSALYFVRIKQVVNQAQRLGLGVILDVHHYEDLINNPAREEARFLSLWKQIATTFKDEPKNLYFEILNEPTNAISMASVNRLYSKVIPIIRQTNPTRTLIIGGNSWNSVDTMNKIAWPKDKNLVATFHDYGPHEFTHQGAPWTSNQWPVGRKWGSKSDYNELKDTYKIAANFQAKRNVPILVGEFGVIDIVPIEERTQWLKHRRQFMEASGYGWCAWDLAGAFKTYDTQKREWLPGVLEALIAD